MLISRAAWQEPFAIIRQVFPRGSQAGDDFTEFMVWELRRQLAKLFGTASKRENLRHECPPTTTQPSGYNLILAILVDLRRC